MVRNCWFKVHQWDRFKNVDSLDFSHAPLWIQIWGLPLHCKSVSMGKQLGAQLGTVEDSAVYDYLEKARIIKIKVSIYISKPIIAGMYIGNEKDGITWLDFRYENLPMFCFNCGIIGHNEENCT